MSQRVRASSLAELFDCPARWEAKHIKGLRMPSSAKAALGSAIHASTAAFDSAALLGSPISINDAAGVAVDAIHKPKDDVDWSESTPQEAEKIAIALHDRYCEEIAPQQTYIAVEATCESLIISDLGLTLTGSVDRVRELPDGSVGIADLKSGSQAVAADGTVKTQGHGLQMAVYELLAERSLGKRIDAPAQIIGLKTGKTERGQRVGTGLIDSARSALVGTPEQPGALVHAANFIRSGAFYGNPRSPLCNPKYCPAYATCNYRK